MELSYNNYFNYKNKIEDLYLNAFPKNERFPFWILEECSKENNSELLAITDNNIFVGMTYIVNCDDSYYLMYLAVKESLRNKKYGSTILKDLKEKYKILFLSIEEPVNEISKKREKFYINNGFYNTDTLYKDNGVIYEILCTDKQYLVTRDKMLKRYKNMTNRSEIFSIISNCFNSEFIEFK